MRLGFRLLSLALALVATLVAAESELAHAMEVIYMFSKYEVEGQVYPRDYWIAPDCAKGLNRRCNLNEFVSYIKKGNRATGPTILDTPNSFNWRNAAAVESVATKLAGLKDGSQLYMAGELQANRVMSAATGITNLFDRLQEFDRQVNADIAKLPTGNTKNMVQSSLDTSNNVILRAAHDLRLATRNQYLHDELVKKFSPTGKFDKIYEYEKDGKTLRFDPIQWAVNKNKVWGREYQSIDFTETKAKNPQLGAEDNLLQKRVDAHIALFNTDGSDGRGRGLVNYDPRNAGTNGRHQHVINVQRRVGQAYKCK